MLTDGQIRWEDLVTPLAKQIDGFEINGLERWFDNNVYYRRPILRKAPVRRGPMLVEDYRVAKACACKPVKAVLPGPYTFVKLSEDRYYKNESRFMRKIAELLNEEARALEHAGAPVIQFDEPSLGFGKPPITQVLDALAIATRGLKATTALYLYFGHLNGLLEPLQEAAVDLLGVDVVSDPNALGAVRRVKWSKRVALGCLDARNTKLESVTELHALFDVVAKRIPLDLVTVNPSCGLEFLPYEQAVQKLTRLVEAVRTYRPRSGRRS
jgi:5-methyltetrahydropteroyltriglutamate--homocysteine methyltransferase